MPTHSNVTRVSASGSSSRGSNIETLHSSMSGTEPRFVFSFRPPRLDRGYYAVGARPAGAARLAGGRRSVVITHEEQREAQAYAAEQLAAAGVVLTDAERASIEVADFGLARLREWD